MRNDQRQRIFMFREDVDEMNVEPVDLGDELRQGVHFGLDLAPVVLCRPITRQRLSRRELHSLRGICNGLAFRPFRSEDALFQIGEFRVRNVHLKRAEGVLVRACCMLRCVAVVCVIVLFSFTVDFPKVHIKWQNCSLLTSAPGHA